MKIQQRFLCDRCSLSIESLHGKIFQGNVYMVTENVEERSGLIGNNFPIESKSFTVDEIKESVLCNKCILEILELQKKPEKKEFEEMEAFFGERP